MIVDSLSRNFALLRSKLLVNFGQLGPMHRWLTHPLTVTESG